MIAALIFLALGAGCTAETFAWRGRSNSRVIFDMGIDEEIAEAEYRMRLAKRDGHWLAYRDRKKQLERLLRRKRNGN